MWLLTGIGQVIAFTFDNIDKITSLLTSAGIIAGLIWFYRRRASAPRANLEHQVSFIDLDNQTTYVGVQVVISNTGNVAIRPKVAKDKASMVVIEELKPYLAGNIESQELSPEYNMGFLGSRTFPAGIYIEPGEQQSILFEFIIQNTTEAIKVYSYLDNSYNGGIGWTMTTTHEVKYDK